MTFGGDFTRVDDWAINYNNVPTITLGSPTDFDPADTMFTAANFPGSSAGDRNNARALYALLTGRRLVDQRDRPPERGRRRVHLQRPDAAPGIRRTTTRSTRRTCGAGSRRVTITAGRAVPAPDADDGQERRVHDDHDRRRLRPVRHSARRPLADRFCNMFKPGDLRNPTVTPEYVPVRHRHQGLQHGLQQPRAERRRRVAAERAGRLAAHAAGRPGTGDGQRRLHAQLQPRACWTSSWTSTTATRGRRFRPRAARRRTRSRSCCRARPGRSSTARRAGSAQPAFKRTPRVPDPGGVRRTARSMFDPDIQVPYTDSWNVSFQRVDHEGHGRRGPVSWATRTGMAWTLENWNAINVYETGWLNGEFEKAQQQPARERAGGAGPTIAFRVHGHPARSPLPIMLAHLSRSTDASNPAALPRQRSGRTRRSTGALDPFFPDPYGFADDLYTARSARWIDDRGISTRLFNNALALGYPTNFWVLNPQLNEVDGAAQQRQQADEPPGHAAGASPARGRASRCRSATRGTRQYHGVAAGLPPAAVPPAVSTAFRMRSRRSGRMTSRSVAASGTART